MVIRTVVSGARAVPGLHFCSFAASIALSLCTTFAVAQAPAGTPVPTPTQDPATQSPQPQQPAANPAAGSAATNAPTAAPTTQDPAAVASTLTFGKVVVDKAALRCWSGAVAAPPVFEEVLSKDQVVALGRSENGFRAVQLPLGPLGFVSKKFTTSGDDGVVKTKGSKVAFRYRPRSSEAPVAQLEDGTTLHVIGEQDDWYRVRVAGVDAWVAEAEVQAGAAGDPALAKAWDDLQQKHQGEIKARLDAIAAQRAREVQDQADLAALQLVQDAFLAEKQKEITEQKYAPLAEVINKLKGTLAAESAAIAAADALMKRIDTQQLLVESTILVNTKPPVIDLPPPEAKDPLERFHSIGWLRYERRLAGPGVYFLEKGGQRLYVLSCNTGRYDLALFVDHEVAINGPRRRPVTESLSVLDAERIEVLGTPQ